MLGIIFLSAFMRFYREHWERVQETKKKATGEMEMQEELEAYQDDNEIF